MVVKVSWSKVAKPTCLKDDLGIVILMLISSNHSELTWVSESKVSMCTTASQWLLHTSQLVMK